jgi:hypothetical protein
MAEKSATGTPIEKGHAVSARVLVEAGHGLLLVAFARVLVAFKELNN